MNIGPEYDLTSDLYPTKKITSKVKIIKEMKDFYLPVSGESSFSEGDVVVVNKSDCEIMEKHGYAICID